MQDNIYQYPDASAIEEEAASWLVRLDGDVPPSAEELDALREWLNRSPAHRKALDGMARFWSNNVLTELSVPLGKKEPGRAAVNNNRKTWYAGGLAAAVLVLAMTAVFYGTSLFVESTNGLYVTAVGQQKSKSLDDGSLIQLNTNSQVNVEYSGEFRDVHLLQGEAHFIVAKDRERPFRVYVGNSRVQAVGTAFTVYARGADIDVTVTEGTVLLEALDAIQIQDSRRTPDVVEPVYDKSKKARRLALLGAGQKTTVNEARADKAILAPITAVEPDAVEQQLSWRKGFLSFNGESLNEVVAEISRYTTVKIEIADPTVGDIKIGGQLQVGETDAMLDALEANFGLRVTRLGYNYVQLSADTHQPHSS